MCRPDCPYFRCLKKTLAFKTTSGRLLKPREYRRGSRRAIAWCLWANDLCQGPRCQYASCVKHAMKPDGTCGLELLEKASRVRSIEEEALALEHEYSRIRDKLKKIGISEIDL